MTRGICPFAVWRPTANFGYPQGRKGQNRPLFIVSHIMGGWKRTLDDPGWRESAGVGVHFGIGTDGSVSQYTDIFDAHWGNGISGSKENYDRSNRHLAALEKRGAWSAVSYAGTTAYALTSGGVNLPNSHSISIEHEGLNQNTPWTEAMIEASIRVQRWCLEELAREGMPMVLDADALVGHFQIDGVHRPYCPGTAWPKERVLAALAGKGPEPEEDEMYHPLFKDAEFWRDLRIDTGSGGIQEVKRGDTLWSLAQAWGTSIQAIRDANGLTGDALTPGQKLKVPGTQRQAINCRADFGWPADAKYGLIQILVYSGTFWVYHSDGTPAVEAGWGESANYSVDVLVQPNAGGWIEIAGKAHFAGARGLAYWT